MENQPPTSRLIIPNYITENGKKHVRYYDASSGEIVGKEHSNISLSEEILEDWGYFKFGKTHYSQTAIVFLKEFCQDFEEYINTLETTFQEQCRFYLKSEKKNFVKDKKVFGTSKAYENLLSDTELAMPSKRRVIKQMADALYVLVGSGYLGSTYLGKILDPYHWGKARLMWDLDADYPLYADDYWIFAAGFI